MEHSRSQEDTTVDKDSMQEEQQGPWVVDKKSRRPQKGVIAGPKGAHGQQRETNGSGSRFNILHEEEKGGSQVELEHDTSKAIVVHQVVLNKSQSPQAQSLFNEKGKSVHVKGKRSSNSKAAAAMDIPLKASRVTTQEVRKSAVQDNVKVQSKVVPRQTSETSLGHLQGGHGVQATDSHQEHLTSGGISRNQMRFMASPQSLQTST